MSLPPFTKVQQDIVINCLIACVPHREIARLLQELENEDGSFDEEESIILPEGMSQGEYEEIVIKRCKDYVSNKSRKWYQVIKAGREQRRKWLLQGVLIGLYDTLDLIKSELQFDAMMDLKEVTTLHDKTWEMRKHLYRSLYGDKWRSHLFATMIPPEST